MQRKKPVLSDKVLLSFVVAVILVIIFPPNSILLMISLVIWFWIEGGNKGGNKGGNND